MERCALLMARVASPSEIPGARLNEIVTDGNWALVIHSQRYVRGREVSERRQRYGCAARRSQVNILQGLSRLLELRRHFHDYVVLIQRAVHGGYLPLSECIIERIVDVLRSHPQAAGGIAVDHQLCLVIPYPAGLYSRPAVLAEDAFLPTTAAPRH